MSILRLVHVSHKHKSMRCDALLDGAAAAAAAAAAAGDAADDARLGKLDLPSRFSLRLLPATFALDLYSCIVYIAIIRSTRLQAHDPI